MQQLKAVQARSQRWYWAVPYAAVVLFALTMLALVWLLQAREAVEGRRRIAARGDDEPCGHQRVRGLVGADQRQVDAARRAAVFDLELLPERSGSAGDEANPLPLAVHTPVQGSRQSTALTGAPDQEHAETPFARVFHGALGPSITVAPDDCGPAGGHDFVEQPHLGGHVVIHARMIIHVVAAQIGKACNTERHAVEPALVEAMDAVLGADAGSLRA